MPFSSLKKRSTKVAIPASPAKKATPAKSAKDSSMSKSRLSTSRRSPRIAELSTHEEEPIITPTTSKKSNMTDNRRSLFAPPASASPSLKKKPSKAAPNRNKSVDRLKAQSTLDVSEITLYMLMILTMKGGGRCGLLDSTLNFCMVGLGSIP